MAILQDIEPPSPMSAREEEKTKQVSILAKIKTLSTQNLKLFLDSPRNFLLAKANARILLKANSECSEPKIGASFVQKYDPRNLLIGSLPHLVIIVLALVVVVSNWRDKANALALYSELVYVDPSSEYSILQGVGGYTPMISGAADLAQKASSNTSSTDGFVSNIGSVETTITAREDPLPDNSSKTVTYSVRDGDTLTGIGWKFGVKIATLKYLNDISDTNLIRPGVSIKIPPRGYEVSASAIAKKASEDQLKLAMSKRSTLTRGTSTARAADTYQASGGGVDLNVPVAYDYISRGVGSGHTGIDYVAGNGTPVYASASGVIIQVSTGWSGGYGNEIVISHGGGIATRYAHLSRIKVSAGETVSKGQLIGNVGNSGRSYGASGGYHLHFEELVNGHWVRPKF